MKLGFGLGFRRRGGGSGVAAPQGFVNSQPLQNTAVTTTAGYHSYVSRTPIVFTEAIGPSNPVRLIAGTGGIGTNPANYTVSMSLEYSGVNTPLYFSGSRYQLISGNAFHLTDTATPTIPAGATAYVRSWVTSSNTGSPSTPRANFSGVFAKFSNEGGTEAERDSTGALSGGTVRETYGYAPIQAVAATSLPTYFLMGDSIMRGLGDTAQSRMGVIARFIPSTRAFLNFGRDGQSMSSWQAAFPEAMDLIQYATHVVSEFGLVGPSTMSDYNTFFAQSEFTGKTIWQTTHTPRSNSSDGWTTLGNQSVFGSEITDRDRCIDIRNGGVTAADKVLDLEPALLDPTDNTKRYWKSPGGVAQTADGVHPNTAGYTTVFTADYAALGVDEEQIPTTQLFTDGADAAPSNSVLPSISGTERQGQTLTAANGTWAGTATISYAYQWKRNGTNIGGATSSTYVLVEADVGATITVQVTATNFVGSTAATSAATGAIETASILDLVTAGAAYSTRKLRTAYAGSAIRVRRSSDNTEQDIGFNGLALDETALTTFVGANSGFIVTWYDQSGNGRNVTQATTSQQPRLVNAGTIERINGVAAPYFDVGPSDVLANTSPFAFAAGAATIFIVHDLPGSDGNNVWRERNSGGSAEYKIRTGTGGNQDLLVVEVINDAATYVGLSLTEDTYTTTPTVTVFRDSGSSADGFKNGTIGTTRTYSRTGVYTLNQTQIGGDLQGNIAEIIVFASELSNADMNLVAENQGEEYGITVSPFLTPVERLALINGTGDSGNSYAANLGVIRDWEEVVFLDRAKQGRGWRWRNGGGDLEMPAANLDSLGRLASLPSGLTDLSFVFSSFRDGGGVHVGTQPDRSGTFRLTITSGSVSSLTGNGLTGLTDLGGGVWEFSHDGIGNKWVNLVASTFPLGMQIVRTDQIALHAGGAIFDPDWLAMFPSGGCFRFMDWMNTNGSPIVDWADYPTINHQSWQTVPFEVMTALCNLKNADMWICIPHEATDAFATAAATYVEANLETDLKLRVEYSNEVWNSGFPQAAWLRDQAQSVWGVPDGYANGLWIEYAGKRYAQIMQAVLAVFVGQESRVIGVGGGQAAGIGVATLFADALSWQTYEPLDYVLPASMMQEITIAPYINYLNGTNGTTLGNAIKAELDISHAAAVAYIKGLIPDSLQQAKDWIDDNIQAAADRDCRLTIYEYNNHYDMTPLSGSNLFSGGNPVAGSVDAFVEATYSSEMADAQDDLRDYFKAQNGSLMAIYNDMNRASRFGTWGARTHREHTSAIATAWEAWHVANPRWWAR